MTRRPPIALALLASGLLASSLALVRADEQPVDLPIQCSHLEISGIAPIKGGYLLVDDELVGAVAFLPAEALAGGERLDVDLVKLLHKRKSSQPYTPLPRLLPVQDFEDVATDGQETVWLLGSHDGKDGERRTDREFIVRAEWSEKDKELEVRTPQDAKGKHGIYTGLIDHLKAGGQEALTKGLNAEGLAYREGRLWIGLRAPLSEGKAVLLGADEKDLFGKGDGAPKFERRTIDLAGGGVRGLCWDAQTSRLLILSGPVADQGDAPHALWAYDLDSQTATVIERFDASRAKPEGVCRRSPELLALVLERDEPSGSLVKLFPFAKLEK